MNVAVSRQGNNSSAHAFYRFGMFQVFSSKHTCLKVLLKLLIA